MGCSPNRPLIYNNLQDVKNTESNFLSGPYINNKIESFEEIEKKYKDMTFIEEVSESFSVNRNAQSLGYRRESTEKPGEFEREFTYYTYGEVTKMADNFSKNLRHFKLTHSETFDEGKFQLCGIFSKNCPEWIITDIACQMNSITTVTFYSTLGDIAFEHICNETKVPVICIAPASISLFLKYYLNFGLKFVENIVVYDLTQSVTKEQIESLEKTKLGVRLFSDLISEHKGVDYNSPLDLSKPDTVLTLCYTSGTTGLPKGAQLTQRNFIAQMVSLEDAGYRVSTSSVHLSYLPLAHVMERFALLVMLLKGAKIGFAAGDIRTKLTENMEILRPTILIAVPRVLDAFRKTIYGKIDKMEAGCKKSMAEKAIRVKKENFRSSGAITHRFYDSFVFSKVKATFGGRLEAVITGSAPMTRDLSEDIKILFGIPIIEGYGMTECTGALVCTHLTDLGNESCGGTIQTLKFKLLDVPEMNYSSKTRLGDQASPTGEILMKGPCIFKGYFMNPEETKKAIDSDGWLHTGDVGRIMPGDNGLKIIDRVKEIFKLSQGEYIAPSKLESIYSKSKYILQICVYGDSHHSFLIGIVVPNKENVNNLAKELKLDSANESEIFTNKNVIETIKSDFDALAKENNLNGLERLGKLLLVNKEFTIDNGLLTPTLKLVRKKVADLYKAEISKIYDEK
jgi:long-chain acyl-CoA synthetase